MVSAILLSVVLAEPVNLRFAPLPGDRLVYESRQRFLDPKDDLELVVVDEITVSCVQRDSSGVVVFDRSTKPISFTFDGFEQPVSYEPTPLVLRERRHADGRLHSADPDPMDPVGAARLARVLRPSFPGQPVPIGESWSVELPPVTDPELPSAKVDYRLLSLVEMRRRQTALLDVRFVESGSDGITARGQLRLDLETGWPMSLEMQIGGIRIPGGDGDPAQLDVRWLLKDARWTQRR